jgi:uncharacterized membrane protein HdeD (DUF308 family)
MTTALMRTSAQLLATLRGIYFLRFAFALTWAVVLITSKPPLGPSLTILLAIYPLVDAGAVYWQVRSEGRATSPRATEMANIALSVIVAIAVGIASTMSIAAALAVWGAWAALSGITQLLTAVQRRHTGGQIPQMLSGGISVLAGLSFLAQALRGADDIAAIGGYAALGGLFFLVSAIRISLLLRKTH